MSLEKKRSGLFQSAPDLAHRATLEMLRDQRAALDLKPRHTIGGEIEFLVHKELREEREGRIEDMTKRLAETQGHAQAAFTLGNLKSRTSRDFGRSR
jgi:hypothetical protein